MTDTRRAYTRGRRSHSSSCPCSRDLPTDRRVSRLSRSPWTTARAGRRGRSLLGRRDPAGDPPRTARRRPSSETDRADATGVCSILEGADRLPSRPGAGHRSQPPLPWRAPRLPETWERHTPSVRLRNPPGWTSRPKTARAIHAGTRTPPDGSPVRNGGHHRRADDASPRTESVGATGGRGLGTSKGCRRVCAPRDGSDSGVRGREEIVRGAGERGSSGRPPRGGRWVGAVPVLVRPGAVSEVPVPAERLRREGAEHRRLRQASEAPRRPRELPARATHPMGSPAETAAGRD